MRAALLGLLIVWGLTGPSAAQSLLAGAGPAKKVEAVEVELISQESSIKPGTVARVGIRLQHDPHWHTYWRNPGDSGLPTSVAWTLPPGWSAGPIRWPLPQRLPVGPLTNFGYEGQIVLPVDLVVPPDLPTDRPALVTAQVEWLMCKDVCIPGQASLQLELPVSTTPPQPARWASLFETMKFARQEVVKGTASIDGQAVLLRWTPPSNQPAREASFYPYEEGWLANAAMQSLHLDGSSRILKLPLAQAAVSQWPDPAQRKAPLGLLVIDGEGYELQAEPQQSAAGPTLAALGPAIFAAGGSAPTAGPMAPVASELLPALVAAFVGGLILNLMPCVFPVLGLKVLSFAGAEGSLNQSRAKALWFLAGVLGSFWMLAAIMLGLQAAGTAVGWGFQLQSPWFIAAMAVLFTTLALNLLGVFEWGLAATRLGAVESQLHRQGRERSAAAASGALAVVVATPCTAPFMGSALGFTLGQPPQIVFAVFTALGLGLAAPFVILGWVPQALKWLPRPGPWMQTLRQALAFPMFATVVWLLWILAQQTSVDAMALVAMLCLALAFCIWVWQRSRHPLGRALAGSALVVSVIAGGSALQSTVASDAAAPATGQAPQTLEGLVWEPWSPLRVQQALSAGSTVFIDFTAAWCVSCQVNKRLVLDSAPILEQFKTAQVVLLRADWTRRDPAITQALAQYGRSGVPLYLVFRPGESQPRVLPEILTQGAVQQALSGPVPVAFSAKK